MSVSTSGSVDETPGHIEKTVPYDNKGMAGQPRGLSTLFFTELWERMSYYGMRSILILFMVAPATSGGLGWSNVRAAGVYGLYTGAVYLLGLPGGWVADRFMGQWGAVLFGGIFIASGHFTLALESVSAFYAGLCLIVIGTGLLKPNISAMVGTLYAPGDLRRDAGFSIFYMGINLGATIAPFICGSLAQADWFKSFLVNMGFNPLASWHWGFAAAGVGMLIGLTQYLISRHRLARVRSPLGWSRSIKGLAAYLGIVVVIAAAIWLMQTIWPIITAGNATRKIMLVTMILLIVLATIVWLLKDLATEERSRMIAIFIFVIFAALFWASFEQAGSSLNLFADQMTDNRILGWSFPSSYFQAVGPISIILLAPVFAWIWIRLGNRQPSSPAKFSIGLLSAALAFLLVAFAVWFAGVERAAPYWLIGVYTLLTVGELCLSPVGMSAMTRLAPLRLVGLVMGIWFLALAMGNYMAGATAGFFDSTSRTTVINLFASVGLTMLASALLLTVLTPTVRKLMRGAR